MFYWNTVIDLITIARNLREEAKIKVRQPIQEVIIEGKYKDKIESFTSLIEEEINVKNVVFASNMDEYITVKYKKTFVTHSWTIYETFIAKKMSFYLYIPNR